MGEIINKQHLFFAKQAREKLLKNYPKMRKFQDKIDEVLKKAGDDPLNRQVALQELMIDLVVQLKNHNAELKGMLGLVQEKLLCLEEK